MTRRTLVALLHILDRSDLPPLAKAEIEVELLVALAKLERAPPRSLKLH